MKKFWILASMLLAGLLTAPLALAQEDQEGEPVEEPAPEPMPSPEEESEESEESEEDPQDR